MDQHIRTLTDPTTVTCLVKLRYVIGATATTYTYPATVTKDSTGIYHVDVTPTTEGIWDYRWVGTGTVSGGRGSVQRPQLGVLLMDMEPMKAERLTTTKWRVLAIPFVGRPKDGKDTDDEFFSARTDIKADWFDRRPLIWHHGQDQTMKAEPEIGIEDDLEMEHDGWWATAWLDRSHRYWSASTSGSRKARCTARRGPSGTSPARTTRRANGSSGRTSNRPLTLTPPTRSPGIKPAKALADFKSAGIEVDEDPVHRTRRTRPRT